MQPNDVNALTHTLHDLYGDKFPLLAQAMGQLWCDSLATTDPEDIDQAVQRWARQHQSTYAPTLQNLLDVLELLDEEQRALRAAFRPLSQRTTGQILTDAADQGPPATLGWAQAHVHLFLQGFGGPSTRAETAAACRANAQVYPQDARAWLQEAAWWDAGAVGRPNISVY